MERELAFIGMWELLIVLLIVVVIFGANRLLGLGGALGQSIRNFRRSFRAEDEPEDEQRRVETARRVGELPPAKKDPADSADIKNGGNGPSS